MASVAKTAFTKQSETQSLDDAREDVAVQIAALKVDMANLAESVGALASTGAATAKSAAKKKANEAIETGRSAQDAAAEAAIDAGARVSHFAREKPFVALAAAAGLGLLVGMLTAPRK